MLKQRVDVMSTVVETPRLPLQRSIAYGDFANTRCKKSSKLGFNSFNCKIRLRSDVLLRACSKNDILGQHLYYCFYLYSPPPRLCLSSP